MSIVQKFCLIIFAFLSLFTEVNAQKRSPFQIRGQVIDAASRQYMAGVTIYNPANGKGTYSDFDGAFRIEADSLPAKIRFSFIGYETFYLVLDEVPKDILSIKLKAQATDLPGIEVTAKIKIEEITEKEYTVKDFLLKEDKILLLAYEGIAKGNELVLMDFDGKILDSYSIKDIKFIENLHKGCLGGLHMIQAIIDYEIGIDSNKIKIIAENDRKLFDQVIEPCITSTEDFVYYKQTRKLSQVVHYQVFSRKDIRNRDEEKKYAFISVVNEKEMRRYDEEVAPSLGYLDDLPLDATEKENLLRRKMEDNLQLAMLIRLFYKPIYVPLFNLGHELCVFNHIEKKMVFYEHDGTFIDETKINYTELENWDEKILFDEFRKVAYAIFNHPKGKELRSINMTDGSLGAPILIECIYIEKMIAHNGHIFYLESGLKESERNRVLHKVKL